MTDFRALCAELVELLEDEWYGVTREPSALVNARTLLSQPEPQGPDLTACDLLERFIDYFWDEQDAESFPNAAALVAQARALLAQPEPQGPTDEEPTDQEIEEWADAAAEVPLEEMDPEVHGWRRCFKSDEFSETIRAALRRWGRPAIEPVPGVEGKP
jgi:hypothetical protein